MDDTPLDYEGKPIRIGSRIELHPGCDLWMRGARFGTVLGIRPTELDRIILRLDKLPARKFSCSADTLRTI